MNSDVLTSSLTRAMTPFAALVLELGLELFTVVSNRRCDTEPAVGLVLPREMGLALRADTAGGGADREAAIVVIPLKSSVHDG